MDWASRWNRSRRTYVKATSRPQFARSAEPETTARLNERAGKSTSRSVVPTTLAALMHWSYAASNGFRITYRDSGVAALSSRLRTTARLSRTSLAQAGHCLDEFPMALQSWQRYADFKGICCSFCKLTKITSKWQWFWNYAGVEDEAQLAQGCSRNRRTKVFTGPHNWFILVAQR